MSEVDLKVAIDAAKSGDVLSFKDVITSAIEDKVSVELELQKMELAGNLFGSNEAEAEVDLDLDAESENEFEQEPEETQVDNLDIPEEE